MPPTVGVVCPHHQPHHTSNSSTSVVFRASSLISPYSQMGQRKARHVCARCAQTQNIQTYTNVHNVHCALLNHTMRCYTRASSLGVSVCWPCSRLCVIYRIDRERIAHKIQNLAVIFSTRARSTHTDTRGRSLTLGRRKT